MTLLRTIASALREGAVEILSREILASVKLPRDVGARRVVAVARIALIARAVADMLDPDGHPTTARAHDHAHERPAAPSASSGVDRVEPVAAGAVEAQGPYRTAAEPAPSNAPEPGRLIDFTSVTPDPLLRAIADALPSDIELIVEESGSLNSPTLAWHLSLVSASPRPFGLRGVPVERTLDKTALAAADDPAALLLAWLAEDVAAARAMGDTMRLVKGGDA